MYRHCGGDIIADFVEILDSTLRDGSQGQGISFSVNDKISIVKVLDELGVSLIEAGNPSSNPKELEFFEKVSKLNLKNSKIVAFGSTRRKNSNVENDENCTALLNAKTDVVSIFGKAWKLHVFEILKTTLSENLKMIEETCAFFKEKNKSVIFDAEHFFDGFKHDKEYAIEVLRSALNGGACCIALCDTNGGTFPDEIFEIVSEVKQIFPTANIGIHCHNDCSMADANAIMAVNAGARHVQGTFLGFGERCGNTSIVSLIPNLQLKKNHKCIPDESIQFLTFVGREIAEIANVNLHANTPYVGRNAFAHKAGMHADGVLKNSTSFEHISPEKVGNERRFLVSEMTGRTALIKKISEIYPNIDKSSPDLKKIVEEIKIREHSGYQYEGAEGSLQIIIRKILGISKPFFELISYKVLDELPNKDGYGNTATLKVSVDGKEKMSAAEGQGSINALDIALREALLGFYPCLNDVQLIDYKVRVMDSKETTASTVRVLITSTDGEDVWTTIGVSTDIIEASWIALADSIEYKLYKQM